MGGAREGALENSGDAGRGTLSNTGLQPSGLRVATKRRSGTITAQNSAEEYGARVASAKAARQTNAIALRRKSMVTRYNTALRLRPSPIRGAADRGT